MSEVGDKCCELYGMREVTMSGREAAEEVKVVYLDLLPLLWDPGLATSSWPGLVPAEKA